MTDAEKALIDELVKVVGRYDSVPYNIRSVGLEPAWKIATEVAACRITPEKKEAYAEALRGYFRAQVALAAAGKDIPPSVSSALWAAVEKEFSDAMGR